MKALPSTDSTWHALDAVAVAKAQATHAIEGLSEAECAARLARLGPNALPDPKGQPLWRAFLGQFASPLIWLLLLAAAVSFLLGERTDALVIVVVLTLNAAVGTFQERRAERSMAALRKLTQVRARVVRQGAEKIVEASELVPGDVLLLAAGDAVPADARLVDAVSLAVAEAVLTGESAPVGKSVEPVPADAILADRTSMVFSGTLVTTGRAKAIVVATGPNSELGHIAQLTHVEPQATPLENRLAKFGRFLVALAAVMFVVVLVAGWARGLPMSEVLLVGISQIVSVVPEGLPVALTVALSVGMRRMAAHRAIVRKLGAVETLGCTTLICTDKTGTLTKNEMTVVSAWLPQNRSLTVAQTVLENGQPAQLDDSLRVFLQVAVGCNDAAVAADGRLLGDPTETALLAFAAKLGPVDRPPRTAEIAFDSAVRLMATAHEGRVFIKGATESVLGLCAPLEANALATLTRAADEMAGRALRVLAFAVADGPLDVSKGFEGLRGRARIVGLCGEIDPPREGAAEAVKACHSAGIRVAMVTGDHRATGLAIARQLGIASETSEAIEGSDFERLRATLDADALAKRLEHVAVFARVQPEQKLRIVEAMQHLGHVVAMTGDGVNDAPALVRSDVGVGMGRSGTDVAREASAIVVTDDDFATIVLAIEQGRLVYRNIKKATVLLLASSFAEMVILVGAILAGLPMPFAAVQILWNNLVTEGTITLNLVMEPLEGDELRSPPVQRSEPIVPKASMWRLFFLGSVIAAVVLGYYWWRRSLGLPVEEVQTETFTLLAVCEWFNVLNCRSATKSGLSWTVFKNPWLLGGLALSNALQVAVVYLPFMNRVFHTVPISLPQVLTIGAVASVVLWAEEARKLVNRMKSLKV